MFGYDRLKHKYQIMEYFINCEFTLKGVELSPHDIFNDPECSWVSTVEIDRQDGSDPKLQLFYGPTKEHAESMAIMFVNGIECNRSLLRIRFLFENPTHAKPGEIELLLKTAK